MIICGKLRRKGRVTSKVWLYFIDNILSSMTRLETLVQKIPQAIKGEQQVKSIFRLSYVIIAGISVELWKNTNLNHSHVHSTIVDKDSQIF